MRKLLLFAVVFSVACKGADGATGPQGPAGLQGAPGAQGPAGSASRADFQGTIGASRGVVVDLPANSLGGGKMPLVACWITDDSNTWLQVAQTPTSTTWPFCGVSSGRVALGNVPSGFRYWIVVLW